LIEHLKNFGIGSLLCSGFVLFVTFIVWLTSIPLILPVLQILFAAGMIGFIVYVVGFVARILYADHQEAKRIEKLWVDNGN
jgi:hypothetical protein